MNDALNKFKAEMEKRGTVLQNYRCRKPDPPPRPALTRKP